MNEVSMTNALFRISETVIITGHTPIGTKLPEGKGLSKAGEKMYKKLPTYKCTVSSIALLFDMLLVYARRMYACIMRGTGALVVQIDRFLFLFHTDGTLRVSEPGAPLYYFALADAVRGLLGDTNPELKKQFLYIKDKALRSSSVTEEDIGRFCDIYYQWKKSASKMYYEESLAKEEISAAARNTGCVLLPAFDGIPDLAAPLFDISPKKEKTAFLEDVPDGDALIRDCLDGKYRVEYEWDGEQRTFVQDKSILREYIPNAEFRKILKKICFRMGKVIERIQKGETDPVGNDYVNIMLIGKPGTGKTHLMHAVSAATGMPIYVTSVSHNTEEDEFQGMTKMVKGTPQSVPTDALACFEHGGIFLLEEVNLGLPAVLMGALGQAAERPFILKKYGYQTIRRHPLCVFAATMNTGTAGSKPVSQPFSNRFKQTYKLDDPDEESFIKILQMHGASEKRAKWIYRIYCAVTKSVREDNPMADTDSILLSLSPRTCIGALENMEEGSPPKVAVTDSIINKIREQDEEAAKICAGILDALPDLKE